MIGFKQSVFFTALLLATKSFRVNGQHDFDLDLSGKAASIKPRDGCAAIIYNNHDYRYICHDHAEPIYPDYDGFYRIKLYTGFPKDPAPRIARPTLQQLYKWSGVTDLYLDSNSCLHATSSNWLMEGSLIGECHWAAYPDTELDMDNPYWLNKNREDYENGKTHLDSNAVMGSFLTGSADVGADTPPSYGGDSPLTSPGTTTADSLFFQLEDGGITPGRKTKQRRRI